MKQGPRVERNEGVGRHSGCAMGGNAGSLGYPTTESEVALTRWVLREGRVNRD
jgi:hypothetical protein